MAFIVTQGGSTSPAGAESLAQGDAGKALQKQLRNALAHQSRSTRSTSIDQLGVSSSTTVSATAVTSRDAKRVAIEILKRAESRRQQASASEAALGIQFNEAGE